MANLLPERTKKYSAVALLACQMLLHKVYFQISLRDLGSTINDSKFAITVPIWAKIAVEF